MGEVATQMAQEGTPSPKYPNPGYLGEGAHHLALTDRLLSPNPGFGFGERRGIGAIGESKSYFAISFVIRQQYPEALGYPYKAP